MEKDPLSCLPHGPSFRLIDAVVSIVPGEKAVAVRDVKADDPFLRDHFPGNPVMPGVLLVEAMAQTAGLLLPEGSRAVLARIGEARFRRPVLPGNRLRIEAVRRGGLGALHRFDATSTVDGVRVAEAEIDLAVVDETDAKGGAA